MNYYDDLISKNPHIRQRAYDFSTWWDENKTKIERENLHSISGLIRNNMKEDYYYSYWHMMVNGLKLGVNLD